MADGDGRRRELYAEAGAAWSASLERLVRAYEADPEKQRDLLQDVYVALWRSLAAFDGRCSLRTWTLRVAHNVAHSHVRAQRHRRFDTLEDLESLAGAADVEAEVAHKGALERLLGLVRRLEPLQRQVMTLYLEGLDAAAIGEVTGLSATNVATRVHRLKRLLTARFHGGSHHG